MGNERVAAPEESAAISVVVSTYNRAELLPGLVAALEAQEDAGDYEVVIVDNGSRDQTPAVLDQLAAEASIPVLVRRVGENHGPAPARNIGWRAARSPLIAFTDDDCVPDRRWLTEMRAALAQADVVQGLTEVYTAERAGTGPFARKMIIDSFSGKFETCNVGYRRAVLAAIGGFDEAYGFYGEDCDLGWRAIKRGAQPGWAPAAIVLHRVRSTGSRVRDWLAWLRDTRPRRFAARMIKTHPEMRAYIHRRWFYTPAHPPTLAAIAGLALIAARRGGGRAALAGVCLVVPWVRYRAVIQPLPGRRKWLWATLPMNFVVDAAEVIVVIRGAIQFRTPLL